MSTYKIYQIIDANKSSYSFRLPDSKKHVDFQSMTFGSKYADGKLTFGTDDSDIQEVIEAMPKFKSGFITLEREVEQEEDSSKSVADSQKSVVDSKQAEASDKSVEDSKQAEASDEQETVCEEASTPQEAKEWLKANKGIAPVALNTLEKVKSQAEKAGVNFPNVVWPE